MASKGLPDHDMSVLKYVVEKIQGVLTTDEMIKIGAVILLDVNDHFVKEVQKFSCRKKTCDAQIEMTQSVDFI